MMENGGKSDFEKLYLEYRSVMFSIARRFLRHSEDAEDAVQAAFMDIASNMDKFSDPDSSVTRGLVAMITRRRAIDILRKRTKSSEVPLEEDIPTEEIPISDDDTLAKGIAKLPDRQRDVLLLRYHAGYSIPEIAKLYNMKPNAVSRLIGRAKENLRKYLKEEGVSI